MNMQCKLIFNLVLTVPVRAGNGVSPLTNKTHCYTHNRVILPLIGNNIGEPGAQRYRF